MTDPQVTAEAQAAFAVLLRKDFMSFLGMAFRAVSPGDSYQSNWHLDAIGWQLERIRGGESKRLIVTMPPRHLKSITISVAWVAWMLGKDPSLRFICVSYSDTLAEDLALKTRRLMTTAWYEATFPGTRLSRVATRDLSTTRGGGRVSTSTGGTLTGRGADIIIIDDPLNANEAQSEVARRNVIDWYDQVLSSRLNDPERGSIVLVMQRLHEDDLAGHLLESAASWSHLNLPAIAPEDERVQTGEASWHERRSGDVLQPERVSLGYLLTLQRDNGSFTFESQYQQAPVPAGGNMVQRSWLTARYEAAPVRQTGDHIVQSWDTATKDGIDNDYSVGITALLRGRDAYILDVFRAKLKFPDLLREVRAHALRYSSHTILIEDAASGQQLLQLMRHEEREGIPRPLARKVTMDKQSRMNGRLPFIEQGRLILPTEAPWLAGFEKEITAFPNGRHDDQADALAQLIEWAETRYEAPLDGGYYGVLIEGDDFF